MINNNQLHMDKIYTKEYIVRQSTTQLSLPRSVNETMEQFATNLPEDLFGFISDFVPKNEIKQIKWKILSMVSWQMEEFDFNNTKYYFFQLKAWNSENLTKKWWTLIKLSEWQTIEFQSLDNNEQICFDYFIAFNLADIFYEKESWDYIITFKFYLLKRWRSTIDWQIFDLLQRYFNRWFIQEKFNITTQSLKKFNGRFLELNLQWNRQKWTSSDGSNTKKYTEHLNISITNTNMQTIFDIFKTKNDNLCGVMEFEEANAIIEDNDTRYNVSFNLDNEEYLRDLIVELEDNILHMQNDPIDKKKFIEVVTGKSKYNNATLIIN